MPSRQVDQALRTIAGNVALARSFLAGMSFEAFAGDQRTAYAVTRCLEIVSEASRCLPDDLKLRRPNVPWSRIAGAGNIFRHDYEDVLPEILWNTVQHQLGDLETAVAKELE